MYTQNSLPTDSTTGPFPIGFNYVDAATISVTQYDLDGISNPVAKAFTFAGIVSEDQPKGSTINLAVAIASGKMIKIAKTIDMDTLLINWQDGAELTQKNLRKSTRNLMEMAQTAVDIANASASAIASSVAAIASTIASAASAAASAAAANLSAIASAASAALANTSAGAAAVSAAESAASAVASLASSLLTSLTGSVKVPASTTANRDVSPAVGFFRFNTDLNKFEGFTGAAWGSVGGGATGGGSNSVFHENDITVTDDYTITTGKNAMTAGPVNIADGKTVTIPTGSTWSII